MHSFIVEAVSFIRGLGLQVRVPMTDALHDRLIRFAGSDGGVWGEPVRVLTGLVRDHGADARTRQIPVRAAQVAGTPTPPVDEWSDEVRANYQDLAVWNDFTLAQNSPTHFAVWKRTSAAASWLTHAGHGHRAAGLGYVGGISGGLAFGMRDFWRQFPRALDIRSAAGDTATVTLWSWSPHAPVMDLRPYDSGGHGLALAYEDDRDGFGSAAGISRSTDMELWALPATPSRDRIAQLAAVVGTPPQLVTTPETYCAAGVFGRWGPPDRATPARSELEESMTAIVDFYAGQIEQRQWYGFWHFGDIMHTYDTDRHEWRYDVGGAKEARVGESFTRRFMYYLTTDELLGEWMRASLQADRTLLAYNPLRDMVPPQRKAPTRLRIGPDWYALVSNWLTDWERTGDTRWRDRIVTGMRDIAAFPAGLFTGEAGGLVGFDPETAHLVNLEKGDYHGDYKLAMAFCGEQIMFEAMNLVDVPEFRATMLDFARYCLATREEKIARYGFDFATDSAMSDTIYCRLMAWAGEQQDDPELRRRSWELLARDNPGRAWPAAERIGGPAVLTPLDEVVGDPTQRVSTNDAAQRTLAIIALLAIAPKEAP